MNHFKPLNGELKLFLPAFVFPQFPPFTNVLLFWFFFWGGGVGVSSCKLPKLEWKKANPEAEMLRYKHECVPVWVKFEFYCLSAQKGSFACMKSSL